MKSKCMHVHRLFEHRLHLTSHNVLFNINTYLQIKHKYIRLGCAGDIYNNTAQCLETNFNRKFLELTFAKFLYFHG
jgi:hypothetical protein